MAPLAVWSVAMLASEYRRSLMLDADLSVGMYLSPAFPAVLYGLTSRDHHLFLQMNSLALATGVGEGFSTGKVLGLVGGTARMVAGRVPV